MIADRIQSITMAKRWANKNNKNNNNNGSSDCDNSVNTPSPPYSSSSSVLLSSVNRRMSISVIVVVLLSVVCFSSVTVPVQSFGIQRHPTAAQSRFSISTTENRKQLLGVELGAVADGYSSSSNNNGNDDGVVFGAKQTATTKALGGTDDGYDGLGEYDPSENLPETQREVPNVGNPQLRVKEKDWSVTNILKELAAIQQQGPQKYCILGTRHCSYLHQQIIELLAYALVLSGNHVYTSGAPGTNAATVRGALRAEREDLLTVVLPQSLEKQTKESQELLEKVDDLITMPQNDDMSLDVASRICNSYLLSLTDQLVSFAFHESTTVIEANKEAKALDMLVTTLYLD